MPRRKSIKSLPKAVKVPKVEEKEDFRDHIDSTVVSPHLFCSICQEVFKHPHRAPCGHSFCKDCIHEWLKNSKTCPEDRAKINPNDLHHDFILENIIGDQKVSCPFKKYGCSLVCALSTLPSHFKTCAFNVNNLPKFLKDNMDDYFSNENNKEEAKPSNSNSTFLPDELSPPKYLPLKMRMYMQGGEARDGLVNAFSSDHSEYNRLLTMFKSD